MEHTTNSTEKQSRRYPIWLWIILFIVGILAVGLLVITYRHEAWDFRNNLWGPARLLLQGQKPWDLAALSALSKTWDVPFYRSIWFPTSIGVGLPLGLLPLPNATNIWLLLSVAATILSIILIYGAHDLRQTPPALLATGLAVTIFLPLYAHLLLGQVSLLVLASLVAGWTLLEHDRPGWAGIVLSFAWAKPQLVLLVWPALAWMAWKRGQFRPVFLGWLAGSLLQTFPLWILDPTWPAGYLEALRANQDWRQPNLHSLVVNLSGSALLGWVVLLVVLGLATVWLARLWKRTSSVIALAWTLGLTTFLSPYSWSWDQVLLLPLLPVILRTGRRGIHRVIWWIVYLICMVAYAALRLPTSSDVWFAWFPLVFLLTSAYLSSPMATKQTLEGHQSLES